MCVRGVLPANECQRDDDCSRRRSSVGSVGTMGLVAQVGSIVLSCSSTQMVLLELCSPTGVNKGGDCVVAHNHCERSTRSMRSTTSTIWIWQLLVFRGRRLGLGTCGGLDCERVGDATAAGRQILRSTIPPIYPCEYTLSEEQAPDSLTSLQSLVGS